MNKTTCLLFLIFFGCANKPARPGLMVSVTNATTISIKNTDNNLLANTRQDSIANTQWQNMLPVYKMPADTAMKDYLNPLPGKYIVKANVIFFVADTPFQKGKPYFTRFYHFQDDAGIWALLTGKWKQHSLQYRECVFIP